MWRFDAEIFRAINNLAGRSVWLDAAGIFVAAYLPVVLATAFLGAVFLARMIARRDPDRRAPAGRFSAAAAQAAIAAGLAVLGNAAIGKLFFRERPFAALLGVNKLIEKSAAEKSFPSDHAGAAFAVAFAFTLTYPLAGGMMLIAAAAISIGRIFVGVHYPADTIVGAALGCLWAAAVRLADRRWRISSRIQK